MLLKDTLERVVKAVNGLPETQRSVVFLIADGVGRKEICNTLGITDKGLRSRLYRARKTLRLEKLKEE